MAQPEIEYVKVHTLSDRFEADVIIDALKQEGIPVLVRQFMDRAYSNIFVSQKGWGNILVPKEMASLAREIISELTEIEDDTAPLPSGESRNERVSPPFEKDDSGQKLDQVVEQLADFRSKPGCGML